MKNLRLLPVLICLLSFSAVSCESDTVELRKEMKKNDKDVVKISKVTKYADLKNGEFINKSQVKTVSFPHGFHEKEVELACIYCHHKNGNDDRIKECAFCHKGYAGYDTMHGLCVDCHISRNRGPQGCEQCHNETDKK